MSKTRYVINRKTGYAEAIHGCSTWVKIVGITTIVLFAIAFIAFALQTLAYPFLLSKRFVDSYTQQYPDSVVPEGWIYTGIKPIAIIDNKSRTLKKIGTAHITGEDRYMLGDCLYKADGEYISKKAVYSMRAGEYDIYRCKRKVKDIKFGVKDGLLVATGYKYKTSYWYFFVCTSDTSFQRTDYPYLYRPAQIGSDLEPEEFVRQYDIATDDNDSTGIINRLLFTISGDQDTQVYLDGIDLLIIKDYISKITYYEYSIEKTFCNVNKSNKFILKADDIRNIEGKNRLYIR